MLNPAALVLPAAASPQAHLLAYEELTLIGFVPACTWYELARRLDGAALQVPAAFARKYTDRAADCRDKARWMELTAVGVVPTASDAARIVSAMRAQVGMVAS